MYIKSLLIILAIGLTLCFEPGHSKESYIFAKFQEFVEVHNKHYSTIEEYMERFRVFEKNYNNIELMQMSSDETQTFSLGITKYSDMTTQEFRSTYLNLKISLKDIVRTRSELSFLDYNVAPDSHDWRSQGAVGPVKDQGSCGSCWAFSSVANLEGLNYLKTKKFQTFSEQQLVDCDKVDEGCNGGLMENAFQYLQQNGGIELSKDYPYKARDGQCRFDKSKSALQVKGFHFGSQDEEEIKQMLFSTGPLSVALNADTLQFYNNGIIDIDARRCDPDAIDHAVTLVGYGTEKGKDFWIVRNSWGSNWGEKGYFRIARGKGTCGINTHVVTAELE
jgi:C1A family cysteine protease